MQTEAFFVIRNDKTEGPLSRHDLKCYLDGKAISKDSLCARAGDDKWIPAVEMLKQTSGLRKNHSNLLLLGIFVAFVAAVFVVYFFAFFNTSVAVPGGETIGLSRVENIGLLNQRQNGIIIGSVGVIIGIALIIASSFSTGKNAR